MHLPSFHSPDPDALQAACWFHLHAHRVITAAHLQALLCVHGTLVSRQQVLEAMSALVEDPDTQGRVDKLLPNLLGGVDAVYVCSSQATYSKKTRADVLLDASFGPVLLDFLQDRTPQNLGTPVDLTDPKLRRRMHLVIKDLQRGDPWCGPEAKREARRAIGRLTVALLAPLPPRDK